VETVDISSTQIQTPIALTIAGSDSGGGAGIQADLKAFSALGVYGASVITAVTAQNTVAVTAVHEIPATVIRAQLRAVLSDLNIAAVKIGMLSSPEIIEVVAGELQDLAIPVVLDPVMVAKSGDALLKDSAVHALKTALLPRCQLLTPNLPEAARLLGLQSESALEQMRQQGIALRQLGADAVLMKGGHAKGETCVDLLIDRDGKETVYSAPRINTGNTHGTGCTLSAAIAANLARGLTMRDAVAEAHGYLHRAIAAADTLDIGRGHGPVHHFHGVW
jgi:hydroxymethylpyrimidine/phosphomethylpyrimidine kinase